MNEIFLPTLKSIKIKDFSLYPNGLDYEYKFVNGVNIIFGGNGLGKTTFINLLKYGIIGGYAERYGHRRTYLERQIIKRRVYPSDFFADRMDASYEKNDDAKITVVFKIRDTTFEVTRKLKDFILEKVKITEKGRSDYLTGKIITQEEYEAIEDNEEKKAFLQKKFEDKAAKCANLGSFDDIIFFVTTILVFEESHKTILWDDNKDQRIVEDLSSKYWNDPELDIERQKAKDQAKYLDSLYRHKSEDIRAIENVIDKIKTDNDASKSVKDLAKEVSRLNKDIQRLNSGLDSIYKQKEALGSRRNILSNQLNSNLKDAQIIEAKISKAEFEENKQIWEQINPSYKIHHDLIRISHHCPMCNKVLPDKKHKQLTTHENHCFVCEQPLNYTRKLSFDLGELQKELRPLSIQIQQQQSEINKIDEKIDLFEDKYRELSNDLFTKKSELWALEHTQNKKQTKDKGSVEFNAMRAEINKLESEKTSLLARSKKEKEKVERISQKIENENIKIATQLSQKFSEYAEKFLGIPCKLTYDDFKDGLGKRFVPIINGKERLNQMQLSESQRFFIDHSYRMSLLDFFYRSPTFYICETPDSSLDMSYERNAANVFLNYLKKPNSLIITSNLNNSEFLQYIIDKAESINYVNLLQIGKRSKIQMDNKRMNDLLQQLTRKLKSKTLR